MSFFICVIYVLTLILCTIGMYHNSFNANFLQRVALVMMAFWFVWRISLVFQHGWGYPHEQLIAMAMLVFAIGSTVKTLKWR